MPSAIIQREKICSSKTCLEAAGICHLWWGDDSSTLEKKTTGEIILSMQMYPGIEPSNVSLNTSLLGTYGIKAAARLMQAMLVESLSLEIFKSHTDKALSDTG